MLSLISIAIALSSLSGVVISDFADCEGTPDDPCEVCDVDSMTLTLISAQGSTSNEIDLDIETSGTCLTLEDPFVFSTSLGYTFCPDEGQYNGTLKVFFTDNTYEVLGPEPVEGYFVDFDSEQGWCECGHGQGKWSIGGIDCDPDESGDQSSCCCGDDQYEFVGECLDSSQMCLSSSDDFDMDKHQEACQCTEGADAWGPGGIDCDPIDDGDQTDCCCGDDSDEFLSYCIDAGTGVCSESTDDISCCPSEGSCVFSGVCYSDGSSLQDVGYCSSGTWGDSEPPETTCVDCPGDGTTVGKEFVIKLSAQDAGSGVAETLLCHARDATQCSGFEQYSDPVTVGSDCPDGETCDYYTEFYSVDYVGNEEGHKSLHVTIDRNLPTCEFVNLPEYNNKTTTTLEWVSEDPVSGSTFVEYSIQAKRSLDGGSTYQEFVDSFTINEESQTTRDVTLDDDGLYRFECEATYDRSGNTVTSSIGMHSMGLDTVPPVVSFTGSDTGYSNQGNFTLTWEAQEDMGMDYYVVRLDGEFYRHLGGSVKSLEYEGAEGGEYSFTLIGFDLAGNPSQADTKDFVIDSFPPSCDISSLPPVVNKTTFMLNWSGQDTGSGIKEYDLCIKSEPSPCTSPTSGWTDIEEPSRLFTGLHNSTYYFSCQAFDMAGNKGDWSDIVGTRIDSKAPEIDNDEPQYSKKVASSDYQPMLVNAIVSDESGIDHVSLLMGDEEVEPVQRTGSSGDTQWTLSWEIPYETYVDKTGFSIVRTDVNQNTGESTFNFSVIECEPGDVRPCNPEDGGVAYGQGICRGTGNRTCLPSGMWGGCEGGQLPEEEACNSLDDDCDGEVDEDLSGSPCGPDTDYGICEFGSRDCINGEWTRCEGAIFPMATEDCGNSRDDDCDGTVNNGCECISEGETKPCGESNMGVCALGSSTCVDGQWSDCVGAIFPSTEICGDGIDNDCDGQIDEGCGDQSTPQDGGGFPWWLLSLIGIVILAVVLVLWYYFKRNNQELTWENLKSNWGSS